MPVGTGQLLRSLALFSLVNALAERLRGVFTPYFSLLLDACVAHLSGALRLAGISCCVCGVCVGPRLPPAAGRLRGAPVGCRF